MRQIPGDVKAHELDMVWQQVFTWVSWAIVVVMVVIAWRMCRRERTPFYLLACLAAGVAAFAEPLYDVAFDLWFYDAHHGQPGAAWAHFTAFDVVQPNWTHSGYVILYSSACLYVGRAMYERRLGRRGLFLVWFAEMLTSCVFEVVGTGTDVLHLLRLVRAEDLALSAGHRCSRGHPGRPPSRCSRCRSASG